MNKSFEKFVAALLLCFLLVQTAAFGQNQVPEQLKTLDSYIEKGLSEWQIPGLSIAILKDDKIVFAKGFGVRESGKSEKVDEKTLFGVGSITKSFTAASLGILADEKRLSFDDAVTKHLPSFQLFEPSLTQNTTLRDLLSHRTGLPRERFAFNWIRP